MAATTITDGFILSVGLVPAEAREDRHAQNAATARINRTECGQRSVAILVASNCDPAGIKPMETVSQGKVACLILREMTFPAAIAVFVIQFGQLYFAVIRFDLTWKTILLSLGGLVSIWGTHFRASSLVGRNMELDSKAIERVCELMNAKTTDQNHEIGFSLNFSIAESKYTLLFGLPDDLVVLMPPQPFTRPNTQFVFRCNSIEIHTKSKAEGYMLCFTDERDGLTNARLLIAGDENGPTDFRFISIEGSGSKFQFPEQL